MESGGGSGVPNLEPEYPTGDLIGIGDCGLRIVLIEKSFINCKSAIRNRQSAIKSPAGLFSCNSCYSWPSLQAAPRGLEAGQPQALPRQIAVRGVHKRHRVSRVEDPKVFFLREGFQIRAARPLPVLAVAMPIRFKVV